MGVWASGIGCCGATSASAIVMQIAHSRTRDRRQGITRERVKPRAGTRPYSTDLALLAWEFPRLCRGGSRSLTYTAVGHPGNLQWLTHENACGAARPSINLKQSTGMANTVRCFHLRSLGLDILARRRHHGNCSAFRSLELGPNHRPLQAALSGSLIKAPGFPGDTYLIAMRRLPSTERWSHPSRLPLCVPRISGLRTTRVPDSRPNPARTLAPATKLQPQPLSPTMHQPHQPR